MRGSGQRTLLLNQQHYNSSMDINGKTFGSIRTSQKGKDSKSFATLQIESRGSANGGSPDSRSRTKSTFAVPPLSYNKEQPYE